MTRIWLHYRKLDYTGLPYELELPFAYPRQLIRFLANYRGPMKILRLWEEVL